MDRCVRIEESFATVQESRRYNFGASRKAPKTKGVTLKRANRRRLADPRAPQQGSSAMWVGHGRASQTQGLGHPMAEPQKGQGTPCWVPDSPFSRYPSTFRGVWRVKRPLNPTKQGPLRPYRRELRNGSRITSIRLWCFEKSPENQRSPAQKSEPTTPGRPPTPQAGGPAHMGRQWPSLADTGVRPSHGRAPERAGDPLLGPRQPVF